MSLPASDPFDPPNTFPSTGGGLGANWTDETPGLAKFSGTALGSADSGNVDWDSAYWSADSFNADQYSEAPIGQYVGYGQVTVRASGSGSRNNYAGYIIGDGRSYISKYVSGAETLLAGSLGSYAAADTVRVEAEGTTIRLFRNGSSMGSATDATHATGAAGLASASSDFRWASWTGGNLGASGISLSPDVAAAVLTGRGTSLGFAIQMPDEP
jgi:hypothetical protein